MIGVKGLLSAMLRIDFRETGTGIQLRGDHSDPSEGDDSVLASPQDGPNDPLLDFCPYVVPFHPESCLLCVNYRILQKRQGVTAKSRS